MLQKIDYLITRGLLEVSGVQRGLGRCGCLLLVLVLVVGWLVGWLVGGVLNP